MSRSYTMLSFSLSSYVDGSLALNCVKEKEAYSSSAVRSMVILAEDGEGVCSFRFFCALTGPRLTHTTSHFGDKVRSLRRAFRYYKYFSALGS